MDKSFVQNSVSTFFWTKLLPIIDKVCNDLSPAGCIHRISNVDLDLGVIQDGDVHKINLREFEFSFRRQLQEKIDTQPTYFANPTFDNKALQTNIDSNLADNNKNQSEQNVADDSRLQKNLSNSAQELLEFFIETGSLPWWAEAQNTEIVSQSFQRVCESNSAYVRQKFLHWIEYSALRKRIILHISEDELFNLIGLYFPKKSIAIIQKVFENPFVELKKIPKDALKLNRWILWEAVFVLIIKKIDTISLTVPNCISIEEIESSVLSLLSSDIRKNIEQQNRKLSSSHNADKEIREQGNSITEINKETSSNTIESSDKPTYKDSDIIENIRGNKNESEIKRSQIQNKISNEDRNDNDWEINNKPEKTDEKQTQKQKKRSYDDKSLAKGKENNSISDQIADNHGDTGQKKVEYFPNKKEHYIPKQTIEEYYISNSGLVILWPFYTNFFTQLGFIENGQFKDLYCQHRAAYVLQYLSTGVPSLIEFSMPLIKVMCGIPLYHPFEPMDELTEDEMKDSDTMLEAVISQVEILNNMSIDGFRGSFLLREGVLKPQNSQWNLNVKRETFDIVLDRFSWPFNIVKLPWMEQVIFADW